MVIQCSECQTRFKLADDKMKPGGIKVRCAKCKHVFSVQPTEPVTETTSVATTAAANTETSFAGLQEEDSAREFSLGQHAEEKSESDTSSAADAFGLGDSAEKPAWDDFSFADLDDAPPANEIATATAADDFDLGSTPPAQVERPETQADDFDFSPEPQPDLDDFSFEETAAPPANDDFGFGLEVSTAEEGEEGDPAAGFDFDPPQPSTLDDDFAFGDGSADRFDDLLGDETGSDFAAESKAEDEAIDEFDFAEPPKARAAREVFDFGPEEDSLEFTDLDASSKKEMSWGDLESDAFGDGFDLAETSSGDKAFDFTEMSFQEEAQDDHLGDDDFGSISLDSPSEPEPVKPSPVVPTPSKPDDAADRAPRTSAPLPAPSSGRRGPLNRLVLFVLGLLLTLVGAAGYFLWQSGGVAPLMDRLNGTTPAPSVQPQIRLTDLNGYFVNNKDAGQLFVIQGQATNEFPEIRSAITVKGALYDKGGKLLVQQTVFCGNRLDDTALQDLPFASISEAMNNQFGDSLTNLNVAPGKTLPFTIVFRNFPPELAEFTVESVDSRPGSN